MLHWSLYWWPMDDLDIVYCIAQSWDFISVKFQLTWSRSVAFLDRIIHDSEEGMLLSYWCWKFRSKLMLSFCPVWYVAMGWCFSALLENLFFHDASQFSCINTMNIAFLAEEQHMISIKYGHPRYFLSLVLEKRYIFFRWSIMQSNYHFLLERPFW